MATKPITMAPLTGVLDLRSSPDLIPQGGVRMRQNLQTVADGKLRRGCGWTKLLTETTYNNADFHDQLLVFWSAVAGLDTAMRQPVTMLHEATSTIGSRTLLLATQSRIARLSEHGGNWKILGTGFGGAPVTSATAPRFRAARVGDYVGMTNDWDRPKYHILDQVGVDGESLYEFDDLVTIGLRRAKFVWSWRNFLIFANVEMDGQRYGYRLVSADYDHPTSFDPERADSIAWMKDLMTHEEILGGAPSGNAFLIYTTHGIWEMSIVGGEQTVGFRRTYNGEDNEMKALLAYPNTLVNLSDSHLWAGEDGLYFYNQFYSRPERAEWLHRASSLIFDNLDRNACEAHCAGIHGDEVWISVAETGQTNSLPNVTLRINTAYKACDKVDFGFTAYANYTSQDIQTLRDFIIENQMCDLAGLVAIDADYGYENEGLPNPLPSATSAFEPTSIHTLDLLHLGGTVTVASAGTAAANGTYTWSPALGWYVAANGYFIRRENRWWRLYADTGGDPLYLNPVALNGAWSTVGDGSGPAPTISLGSDVVAVEDYEKTESDDDSLCALLGDEVIDAGCHGCNSPTLFVGASSEDWSLKELGGAFYREECANPTAVGTIITEGYQSATGVYLLNGYDSIFRSGPMFTEDAGVHAQCLAMQYQARAQTPPSEIGLRVGVSGQIADPNLDGCLVWYQHSLKKLKCQSDKTEAEHRAANTQPVTTLAWTFERKGPVLYFELKITGTGGDADFSRLKLDAKRYEMRNI